MIRLQIGQESFQKRPSESGCPHLSRGLSPPDFSLRPQDRPRLSCADTFYLDEPYWPAPLSILLATFTPLKPLTYLEMP
jgi:hypothetical protein